MELKPPYPQLERPCLAANLAALGICAALPLSLPSELTPGGYLNSFICIAVGYILQKAKPNPWLGIRIKWTRASEENWKATHEYAAKMFKYCGAMALAANVLKPHYFYGIVAILNASLFAIYFSFRYYRQFEKTKIA